MPKWFSIGGGGGGGEEDRQQPHHPSTSSSSSSSSLSLSADWNSYASSRASEQNTALAVFDLDLESAVRSPSGTVAGTFNVFSKGVRRVPGNLRSSNLPSEKSLMCFGILLATGVFFVFIAFTMFLPVIGLLPQKFALCFTLGCCLIIGSFFALKGPKNQFLHMSSKERLPFTLGFIGTMLATIYFSMVVNSYILSVLFSVIQVLALAYYAVSCFPRGSAGMKFVLSGVTLSIMKCMLWPVILILCCLYLFHVVFTLGRIRLGS